MNKVINKEQYPLVSSNRRGYDMLIWQTPVLSLTAQAFLFVIAFGSNNDAVGRIIASVLALCTALASMQLMAKHRLHEKRSSEELEEFEKQNQENGYKVIHSTRDNKNKIWYLRLRSYAVWMSMLFAFVGASILAIIISVSALLINC